MTEALLRDALADKERLRDRLVDQDRTATVEKILAILQTRFDAFLERAVQGDDLKELRREMDDQMKQAVTELRSYFDGKTDQQSDVILGRVQTMLIQDRQAQAEDQKQLRRQVFMAVFGSGLSVIGALVYLALTTGKP